MAASAGRRSPHASPCASSRRCWETLNTEQPAQLAWSKSSYSGDEGGVEVAPGGTSYVRDSKERGGPQLVYPRSAWSGFVAGLERGQI
ncbi:DUF397 domain-containing protein [Streptomyces sp. NPDC058954]|uniref:DUF397 domain-containing protein n=1 Tax=Streptomyces sp. NPDC058954 TaxID=3346677 RepID=UPI0036784565